jgi:hypothetical protein
MKTFNQRCSALIDSPLAPAVSLALMAVLAYGLLLPQMGFYWDELPISWIRYELGPEALTQYFSTNRPIWGLLYQLTTRLLPQVPVFWEVFALFWRWLTAILVWGIVRELWPARRKFAVIVSMLFLLYPGFNQQWTSLLYSHFFIVLCFFLFSFLCMLWSFRYPRLYWPLTFIAMVFSALNLWMMEYFFVLELFRLFVILYYSFFSYTRIGGVSSDVFSIENQRNIWRRIRGTVLLWLPYLAVLLADVYWRLFIFNNQIYQPVLISKFRSAPLIASWELLKTILGDLYQVSIVAWAQILNLSKAGLAGPRTAIYYFAVILFAAVLSALFVFESRQQDEFDKRSKYWAIALGLAAVVMAGGPFWLAGLDITVAFPANRFTLPFILGVSLLIAGLLEFLPARIRWGFAVLLVALAAGRQALWADAYRRDWTTQKTMFWQMYWRAPGIAPNTIVLLNEGEFQFYADNSLTGALNWIYDPDNRSSGMSYVLFYPTSRLGGTLQGFEPRQPVTYDYISETFKGTTSQVAAFYYQPPGCLRLLDPEIDSDNHLIPDATLMRESAGLSSSAWILSEATARMPKIYGPQPVHGWCYYFEKADLAGQVGDWKQVINLGDQAFRLSDYPNDPVERFVFIEGYAHENDWTRAEELAIQSYKVSPNYVGPLICKLLDRIERDVPDSSIKESSLNDLRTKFSCLP